MFGIGPMELVVIVVVALLIFGPQRLPELARTLGKGLAEVRRASNDLRHTLALDELQDDLRKTMNQVTRPPSAESRPAQAGDSLPPGTGSAGVPGASPGAVGSTPGAAGAAAGAPGAAAAAKPATSPADPAAAETPPWKNHPGQLPDGGDQDHNDVSPPAESSQAAPPRVAAADPGLGNVPVTGADPAETRRG